MPAEHSRAEFYNSEKHDKCDYNARNLVEDICMVIIQSGASVKI
jgi:hypothetical protein